MSALTINTLNPERSLLMHTQLFVKERRSLYEVTRPLLKWSENSPHFYSAPLGSLALDGHSYHLPRFIFIGPNGGSDYLRVGIFAGIHGDETAGPFALIEFIRTLLKNPGLAKGYELYFYPLCNPTGFEDGTRFSRTGKDLNREFWKQSRQPEVRQIEGQLLGLKFNGLISLHSDDVSPGLYGYARGSTLTADVLEPALQAAERFLPRNYDKSIDNFAANRGIITQGYDGMLTAPPKSKPHPFEIVFETPHHTPMEHQIKATSAALETIITEYRTMISVGQNI